MGHDPEILIIIAETELRNFFSDTLKTLNFAVRYTSGATDIIKFLKEDRPDLIIIDLRVIYSLDGFEIYRQIRQHSLIPIIILTTFDDEPARSATNNLQADAYLTRPFTKENIYTHIQMALYQNRWHVQTTTNRIINLGATSINVQTHQIMRAGKELHLSQIEWQLLELLINNAGRIMTHRMLEEPLWGDGYSDENAYLRIYIKKLRTKLEPDPAHPKYLITKPRLGYCLLLGEEESSVEEKKPPSLAPFRVETTVPERHSSNLPVQPTLFIGRQKEIASILEILRNPDTHLLTITGPGGIGKTRLCLEVASRLITDFADGVFFVPLAPLKEPVLVTTRIMQVLHIKETVDQTASECLTRELSNKKMLLVLDNFEHLMTMIDLISALMNAAPGLKILVTSREILHIYGEREFSVPPLDLPQVGSVLVSSSAVSLFEERARAVNPEFRITLENAPVVAELCRHLDGLPLAIELAAARIKVLLPQMMLVRLSSRLQFLTSNARDISPRQQTLRGAIDWSYDLLEIEERILFARLAVFSGSFTFAAAEFVASLPLAVDLADGIPGTIDVLEGLSSLINKSMLKQEQAHEENRFIMLETIHEYAYECFLALPEVNMVRHKHVEYYLSLAEASQAEQNGPNQQIWLTRLGYDHDNLRAALRWTLEAGDTLDSLKAREMALRLSSALSRFWWVQGSIDEGRRWLARALENSSAVSRAICACAYREAGWLAQVQGDFTQASHYLVESLALFRLIEDKTEISKTLHDLAHLVVQQGDFSRAETYVRESVALNRQAGSKDGIAHSLNYLGLILFKKGECAMARSFLEESLSIFYTLNDKVDIAATGINLANIERLEGNYERAISLYDEGLVLFRELDIKWGIAHSLFNLANIDCIQKRYELAQARCIEAFNIFTELGNKPGISQALETLAAIAAGLKQGERAACLWGASEVLRKVIGAPISPIDYPAYIRSVNEARAQYGEEEFAEAWDRGRVMSLSQVITLYALAPQAL